MTDKPLEQILDEFRESIKNQEFKPPEQSHYQQLTKYASSALHFIKDKSKNLGSFVAEKYQDGTLGYLAKWSIPFAAVSVLAGAFGFKEYISAVNEYVAAAGVGGAMGATLPNALGLLIDFKSNNENPFSVYALRGGIYGLFGSLSGIAINSIVPGRPEMQEDAVMAGMFGGAAALAAGMVHLIYISTELEKQKND